MRLNTHFLLVRARLVALATGLALAPLSCSVEELVATALSGTYISGSTQVEVGSTIVLQVFVRDCDAQCTTTPALGQWGSTATGVATPEYFPGQPAGPSSEILVRGVAPGRATITAAVAGSVARHDVRVVSSGLVVSPRDDR